MPVNLSQRRLARALLAGCLSLAAFGVAAQGASPTRYQQPPEQILSVMRAPLPPVPVLSPRSDAALLVVWEEYASIGRVSQPFLRLAGARVEPRNHSKHDTPGGYGIARCARSLELLRVADGRRTPVALPPEACLDTPVWSADGKRFAFANTTPGAVELWVGDGATGAIRRVPGLRLNPMLGAALQWMPDQQSLVVKAVPAQLGPPPGAPVQPPGPQVQQSDGSAGQSSTYEIRDTLANSHDEALFDHYAGSQIALVDADAVTVHPLGRPAIFDDVEVSPNGRHLLLSRIHRPYSYVTTYERFPREVEVWSLAGRALAGVATVASLPLADRVPIHGVPVGPRDFTWRANAPATLVWAEALDRGDWKVQVPHRDKVMMRQVPFGGPAVEVTRTVQRFQSIDWGERSDTALLYEYDRNRRWFRAFVVDVDHAQTSPRLLWDLSSDEQYAHPGRPVRRQLPNGARVMRQAGDTIYLAGNGASPQGSRPFLDRLDLATLRTERLFRSERTAYERFVAFAADDDAAAFLTWHESPSDPPNLFLRTLGGTVDAPAGEARRASSRVAITAFPDPTPAVRSIKKRLVQYQRADGVALSFTLYTPPGYVEGTRVPAILYAYPLDYADPARAGQVTTSESTFTRLRNYRLLLLAGYAVIDNASFPIVGDPQKAYDTYLEQLVADARAAVEEAVRLGVADPERIGVTGHSHGALMTVNLLAHSNLFRAGVATSGAYNKTLTPFGFQSERRSVWEATDVYLKASPFFYAHQLKTPLLLVHGDDDANPGTTPMQSTKLYEAIRGNGGNVRLVMLPHEPHWYAARESNEHLVHEMVRWFDRYVKNAGPRK